MATNGASGTLVDSNVLLDLFTEDPVWASWSTEALTEAANAGSVAINPLIYAEISVRFSRIEDLAAALPPQIERLPLPWSAGFLAGKLFTEYRRRSTTRRSTLPDFYVGAHAAVTGRTLLTRDPSRYRTYLPNLPLICPPDR